MIDVVQPTPIDLPAPGQPLDRGASSLGLVMLVGALTFGVALATIVGLAWLGEGGGAVGGAAAVLGIVRVLLHAWAGSRLARDAAGAVRAVLIYGLVGIAHALALGMWIGQFDVGAGVVASAAALGWPVAVTVAALVVGGAPAEAARGERAAASVIALLAGLLALTPVVTVLAGLIAVDDRDGGGFLFLFFLVAIPTIAGVLAARSGLRGLGGGDPRGGLRVLAGFGLGISTLAAFVLLLALLAGALEAMIAVPAVASLCAIVPMALRDHAGREEQAIDPQLADGSARLTVGWVLLAHGLVTVAHPLIGASPRSALETGVLFAAGGWTAGEPWLHGAVGALELWAALELLAGTRRARPVALLWALGVIAVLIRGWLATVRGADGLIERWFDEHAARVVLQTAHTWLLLSVPAVTLAVLRRPYVPLTRVRRGGA
jgi:hypothetical protein